MVCKGTNYACKWPQPQRFANCITNANPVCAAHAAHPLAAALQDTYLRQVAADTSMWEPLSLARWPGADAERHYGGDWHSLYMARAPVPLGFPLAADRINTVTAVQQQQQGVVGVGPAGTRVQAASSGGGGGSFTLLPQLAFEDVMRQTFIAGLACAK